MGELKTCGKCWQPKPLKEFTKNKRAKDGLCLYCRSCVSRTNMNRNRTNPNFLREVAELAAAKKELIARRAYPSDVDIAKLEKKVIEGQATISSLISLTDVFLGVKTK